MSPLRTGDRRDQVPPAATRAIADTPGAAVELILIRHGETAWSLSGQHTGVTDLPLTAHGCTEAGALAPVVSKLLAGRTPVLVCSPRRRAVETAALALPGVAPLVDERVAEYTYGDYEGLTSQQIHQGRPDWDIWRDGCPHGESTEQVGERADSFLAEHGDVPQPLVVVTHGHFSRILAARALGLAPAQGRLLASVTASASVVEDRQGERCIALWNAVGSPTSDGH